MSTTFKPFYLHLTAKYHILKLFLVSDRKLLKFDKGAQALYDCELNIKKLQTLNKDTIYAKFLQISLNDISNLC